MSVRIAGSLLTVIGFAFALWARLYLGSNWDAFISLKLDHKLVRTGPYAVVRHPIYAGFVLALIGSVLTFGHLRSLVATTIITASWIHKARLEESFMMDHFGSDYAQYRHSVKRMIPMIW